MGYTGPGAAVTVGLLGRGEQDMATPVEDVTPVLGAPVDLAALVTEEGRLDPVVLADLHAGLSEAIGRMSTLGVTGPGAQAEIAGLRDLAGCVDAGLQVSIAGFATRWAAEEAGHVGRVRPRDIPGILDRDEALTDEFAEADLAPTLRMGQRAAAARITAAIALTGLLTDTHHALRTGAIDVDRARVIATELADAQDHVALLVEHELLPGATGMSLPRLRGRVRTLRAEIDPDYQREQIRSGPEQRCVSFGASTIPGMTDVRAVLTAEEAARLQLAVDKLARRYKIEGHEGSIGQRRADAFMALALDGVHVDVILEIAVPATTLPGSAGPTPADDVGDERTRGNESDLSDDSETDLDDLTGDPDPGGAADDTAEADAGAVATGGGERAGDSFRADPPARPGGCGGLIPDLGIVPTDRLTALLHDPDLIIPAS